jgi:ABC-2 type transport system permease protein
MSAEAVSVNVQTVRGYKTVFSRFIFRSARRGALLYGLLAGFMVSIQGLAFAASYTTDLARAKFATSLASNPALGVLYGEPRHIETPAGYMVYRSAVFLSLIGALWALAVATRLLRGQEEDGRLELLLTGRSSLLGSVVSTLKGLAGSLVISYAVCAAFLIGLGRSPKIGVDTSAALFLALAVFTPALVFMAIGTLASQLAPTRRRAMVYGFVAAGGFFMLRSIGNTVSSLRWLKNLTPFGWVDKMHALTGSEPIWLVPAVAVAATLLVIALYFAKHRDLGESVIADNESAQPRFRLLGGSLGLAFRLNRASFLGWLLGTFAITGIITGVSKTASDALADSPSLTKALGNLSGGASTSALGVLFVSVGGFFVALLLMAFVASGIGKIREDEAKGLLDNFLVGKVSRLSWLLKRVLLLLAAVTVVCGLTNLLSWTIARLIGIDVGFASLVLGGFNYVGPAVLMLGVGTLILGLKPRFASTILYAWIVWSFIVEMVSSVVTFNHYVIDTSLVRQISLVPGVSANWRVFGMLCLIGVVAFAAGAALFTRRDLIAE